MMDRLTPLANLDEWQLTHPRQDIRGWPVRGKAGEPLSTVQDLLVDRDAERVAAITLSDGSTVPVEQIAICDQHVEMKRADGAEIAGARPDGEVREEHIPLVEEVIKVGKREVERGGVKVSSRVVEQPVHEEVRLRDETVEVERRPMTEKSVDLDKNPDLLREREVHMREMDEEAVVAKEAVVTEEVVVRKEVAERVEQVDEQVRRTEVDVEMLEEERR